MSAIKNSVSIFWQKIKAILLGQQLRMLAGQAQNAFKTPLSIVPQEKKSTLNDWLKSVQALHELVQKLHGEIDVNNTKDFDLELLGSATYLFHVDNMLAKIREHLLHLRYLQDRYANQNTIINNMEFIQVSQACMQCHHTMQNLIQFLQKMPKKRVYTEEFVNLIHALELDCASLDNNMHMLTYFVRQQDALVLPDTVAPSPSFITTEQLCLRVKSITHPEHAKFVNQVIDIFEMLSRYYVITRRSVVKGAEQKIAQSTLTLIALFSENEPPRKEIYYQLHQIFNQIESIRFSTHRESRSAQDLFKAARTARHNLRKACAANPLTHDFLQEIEVRRISRSNVRQNQR